MVSSISRTTVTSQSVEVPSPEIKAGVMVVLYAQESTLLLDGSTPNHFIQNSDVKGGAIQCIYSSL